MGVRILVQWAISASVNTKFDAEAVVSWHPLRKTNAIARSIINMCGGRCRARYLDSPGTLIQVSNGSVTSGTLYGLCVRPRTTTDVARDHDTTRATPLPSSVAGSWLHRESLCDARPPVPVRDPTHGRPGAPTVSATGASPTNTSSQYRYGLTTAPARREREGVRRRRR